METIETDEATLGFRWFKDDPLVPPRLQQQWIVTSLRTSERHVEHRFEWRDVPVEYGS